MWSGAVLAAARASPAPPSTREPREAREHQHGDHERAGDHEQRSAVQPVVRGDEPGDERAARDTEVPADREERHRRRRAVPRDPGRVLGRLGVVRRDAEPGEDRRTRARPGSSARSPAGRSRCRRPPVRRAGARSRLGDPTSARTAAARSSSQTSRRARSRPPRGTRGRNRVTRYGRSAGSAPCAKSVARCPAVSGAIAATRPRGRAATASVATSEPYRTRLVCFGA